MQLTFKHVWAQRRTSCLVNSGHFYGGICVACAMFSGDRGHQDILVTKSFTYCTNTTSVLDGHANKLYRIGLPSVDKMDGFIASIVLKVNACMRPNSWQSRRIRIIYYYAGVRQFADWSKTAVMHVCYAARCNTDARCNNRREM